MLGKLRDTYRRWHRRSKKVWLIVHKDDARYLECELENGVVIRHRWTLNPARATIFDDEAKALAGALPDDARWLHTQDIPLYRSR